MADESPEGQEEQNREALRLKRDRQMFLVRFAAYEARIAAYADARSHGGYPDGFQALDKDQESCIVRRHASSSHSP